MKGKIIFFAGIFMVATGLPLTLFAMHLVGEIDNVTSRGLSTSMHVFPDEPILRKSILKSTTPMMASVTLDPEGTPINIFINWDYRNYEILNKTFASSQSFEINKRIIEGEYDISVTNLGSLPVYVDLEIDDSTLSELYDFQKFNSRIVIAFYYLFFFGGIATIGVGAIMWRKRK